jgi:tetratricopeptide (TPR) repeat protein
MRDMMYRCTDGQDVSECARGVWSAAWAAAALAVAAAALTAAAEKVLIYDEEKGIMWAEKDVRKQGTDAGKAVPLVKPHTTQRVTPAAPAPAAPPLQIKRNPNDIHIGRGKDPPELYFRSGIEYFKNGDYENALKNFLFADSADPHPAFSLWVGKCLRQLERYDQMLLRMNMIINTFPESDVADDAMFEMAFYYQKTGDYHKAIEMYTRLTEQYPFGKAYWSGEEFMKVAKEQRQIMRSEMVTMLNILGYEGENLRDLYGRFQKASGLPATGLGDRATVAAIKRGYEEYLRGEEEKVAAEVRRRRLAGYSGIVLGVLAVNLLWLLVIGARIKAKKNQLADMEQVLADMDTRRV